MEWATADDVNREVIDSINNALPLTYLSCGIELQRDAVNSLRSLRDHLAGVREGFISVKDEFNANAAMRCQLMASGILNFLEMWVLLKEDKAIEAWDKLVDAQSDLRIVQRIRFDDGIDVLIQRLIVIEETCFPTQLFFSVAYTFTTAFCTICEKIYGECDHICGRIYTGSICRRYIPECQIQETSITPNPADKRCRLTQVTKDGISFCTLTLRELTSDSSIDPAILHVYGTAIRFD